MKTNATMVTLLVLAAPAWLMAQDTPASAAHKNPDHFYKLNLTVEEADGGGKVTNTRNYVAIIEALGDGAPPRRFAPDRKFLLPRARITARRSFSTLILA